jgi:hypothetical protein
MPTFDCTAVAYDWLLPPAGVRDYDVTLILASCRAQFDPADTPGALEKIWQKAAVSERVYHAQFPRKATALGLEDVSGTLGLLWPASDKLAERKAAAFERLVADAILWLLAGETFDGPDRRMVLLQGPLIPKLRGRLLYRGISGEIPVYTATYQTEWFKRIEAAQNTFDYLPHSAADQPIIGALYPPRGIDRGTRSWVCASGRHDPFHFEIVANMWDCCQDPQWLDKRATEIAALLSKKMLFETDKPVQLPGPLGKATETVRTARKREQEYLRLARFFRGLRLTDTTKLERLAKILPPFVVPEAINPDEANELLPLQAAASFQGATFDEEIAYQWYKQHHADTEVSNEVRRILRKADAVDAA